MFEAMTSKSQENERYNAYMTWSKSSMAKMAADSGERVVMRHLNGDSLMCEVTFR
jgi:hypothetical protein